MHNYSPTKSIKPNSLFKQRDFFQLSKVFFPTLNKPIIIGDIRYIFCVVIQWLLTTKVNPPKVVSTQTQRGDPGPSKFSPGK